MQVQNRVNSCNYIAKILKIPSKSLYKATKHKLEEIMALQISPAMVKLFAIESEVN